MKIAIVGTSHVRKEDEKEIEKLIHSIIDGWDFQTTIFISGGAKGVDEMAIRLAKDMGYETSIFHPYSMDWPGYKKRNIRIAKVCDKLYCISTPIHNIPCYHHIQEEVPPLDHEKTAGCWTLNLALKENKPCKLLVTS